MNTISNVSRSTIRANFDVDQSAMTPEDVIAYVRTRLSQLQDDVNKRSDEQRNQNRAAELLTDLTRKLSALGEGRASGLAIREMRDAFSEVADKIAAIGDPSLAALAEKVRASVGTFDKGFNRTDHFSDGTTYKLNAQEEDETAQKRHDGWVRWNAARTENREPLPEDAVLASQWAGDMFSGRDGVEEGAGKVPQSGGTIVSVTFDDANVSSNLMQYIRDDTKSLQSNLNNAAQQNMESLRNLTQQRQQAVQIMQQMLQALVEQAKAAQQWR